MTKLTAAEDGPRACAACQGALDCLSAQHLDRVPLGELLDELRRQRAAFAAA